jgi:hypothetical protein
MCACNRLIKSPAVPERRKATLGSMPDCCTLGRQGFHIGATVTFRQLPIVRFLSKVTISHGCWLWHGVKDDEGYGRFALHGKQLAAHRASFIIFTGKSPGKMFVCHKCDNRWCTNPAHLFLGTAADNNADMTRKGRGIKGDSHPMAKLNSRLVKNIRAILRSGGATRKAIAKKHGVSYRSIYQLMRNRTWKHVT